MAKDKIIGGSIFALCILLVVGYYVAMIFPQKVPILDGTNEQIRIMAMGIILGIAWTIVMIIGMWIGWTMLTLPPAVPVTLPDEDEDESTSTEESGATESTEQ